MGRKVIAVVGARPNFMKVAPIWRAMDATPHISKFLLHTGQHYDENMSRIFFEDLNLPKPDAYLGVGSGSHGEQTGKIMVGLEKVLAHEKADLIIVVGDVNSTMACAVTAAKIGLPVAHVEAGLRSFDRTMPEEINRMVADIVSDLLFTTTRGAGENLLREGVDGTKIHFVGNVMIDSLHYYLPMADRSSILDELRLEEKPYGLVTLHRPSNVDRVETLRDILGALLEIGRECPLVFPVHPRTRNMIDENKIHVPPDRVKILDPIGYFEFVKLMKHAQLVLTDSGGIQEETTVLGVPCLTIRENTERPITIEIGTNRLVGTSGEKILAEAREVLARGSVGGKIPELWDGKASERIVKVIDAYVS